MAVPYAAEAGIAKRLKDGNYYTKDEINDMILDGVTELTLSKLKVTGTLSVGEATRDVYTKTETDTAFLKTVTHDASLSGTGLPDPISSSEDSVQLDLDPL
jgi:hypothetical protein